MEEQQIAPLGKMCCDNKARGVGTDVLYQSFHYFHSRYRHVLLHLDSAFLTEKITRI